MQNCGEDQIHQNYKNAEIGLENMTTKKNMVRCETSEGMFSNEVAVTLESKDGKVSLFADKDLIREKGGDSYLIVNSAHLHETSNLMTVLLPSESFEKGTRWLDVAANRVAAI